MQSQVRCHIIERKLLIDILESGVAVALSLRAALVKFNISGKISLLGTPGTLLQHKPIAVAPHYSFILAEEGGAGKAILLDKGAYEDMDICLMYSFLVPFRIVAELELVRCHPAPGPKGSVSLSSSLALKRIKVEFSGHTCVSCGMRISPHLFSAQRACGPISLGR